MAAIKITSVMPSACTPWLDFCKYQVAEGSLGGPVHLTSGYAAPLVLLYGMGSMCVERQVLEFLLQHAVGRKKIICQGITGQSRHDEG